MGAGAWWRAATTLALGAAGAVLAAWLRIPAPALVGSAVAVGLAAVARMPVAIPEALRELAFSAIGISIGANVSAETVGLMARWPASIVALVVSLVVTSAASSAYLARVRGWDRETALLASTPGALSMALALAAQGHGDARAVSLSQTLRLMTLTVGLPLLLGAGASTGPPATMSLPAVAALLAGALAAGHLLQRRRVPAPLLIGGMLVTAAAHLGGVAAGVLPQPVTLPAFVITGSYVGARFRGVAWDELRGGLRSGLMAVAIAAAISAAFASAVAWRLRIPFAQAWVAFSPGGAETMAAMAIALGYDPAYVGAHHVIRSVLLTAFLPMALARAARARRPR